MRFYRKINIINKGLNSKSYLLKPMLVVCNFILKSTLIIILLINMQIIILSIVLFEKLRFTYMVL